MQARSSQDPDPASIRHRRKRSTRSNIFGLIKIGKRISQIAKRQTRSRLRTSKGNDISYLVKDIKPARKFKNQLWQVNVKNKILPYLTVNKFIKGPGKGKGKGTGNKANRTVSNEGKRAGRRGSYFSFCRYKLINK